VRDSDANGKPVTRPSEFYIDAAVCMSCSFCVEFCPFDAIKMNHDYELAVFDRYPQLVYDMEELTVPVEYYAALWPLQYAEEEEIRRRTEEEDRAKAEAKARADAEKAAAAAVLAAAPPVPSGNGAPAASAAIAEAAPAAAAISDEAAAKKARLEELKRQAAEKAKQRKESGA